MADGKELKPKSFRIDDETAEKFKEISNTIGGNQQETLAKLIEAFEFQSGKAILTEKKADIEQIEKSYQEQMQKLKADKQTEVDKYQQKYFDLLEQMKTQTAAVEQN